MTFSLPWPSSLFKLPNSLRASSPFFASKASLARTRERAAQPRGVEERSPSLARSREARPNRTACLQASCLMTPPQHLTLRACLHGGGGPQVGEVTCLRGGGGNPPVAIMSHFNLITFT